MRAAVPCPGTPSSSSAPLPKPQKQPSWCSACPGLWVQRKVAECAKICKGMLPTQGHCDPVMPLSFVRPEPVEGREASSTAGARVRSTNQLWERPCVASLAANSRDRLVLTVGFSSTNRNCSHRTIIGSISALHYRYLDHTQSHCPFQYPVHPR